jgi:ATP phosphoribosyltransferase regulatory subunit HisZ
MAMSGEGYSLLQEAIPNLLSHREVGNESNQTEAEKGDLIERLLKDNIISSQTALGLKAYFDAVIEGYLAQTKDANKLPDDWSFLERISELCGAIGNEEALRASEIDDANKAIGSLEAKIAELTEAVNQLEEKVAAGIEPSSPFGLLKQNLAASAGSAIIPVGSRFAALGLMYLTGIPADAIAATAAYLSSKSYK